MTQSALLLRLVCSMHEKSCYDFVKSLTVWSQTRLAPSISGHFTDSRRPKYKNSRGFTLMEMLVVISIAGFFIALSLFMDINAFRGDAFRGEVNALGATLQTARTDALNNIDQKKHGVAIHPGGYDGYIIFEGDSYATADHSKDASIKSSYTVALGPTTPGEIIFDQLSGNGSLDGDITLIDTSRNMSATIAVNHEGRISW